MDVIVSDECVALAVLLVNSVGTVHHAVAYHGPGVAFTDGRPKDEEGIKLHFLVARTALRYSREQLYGILTLRHYHQMPM